MACELRLLSLVEDLDKCRLYLFGDDFGDTAWLKKCIVSISPFGDRILIAYDCAMILLTLQWDRSQGTDQSKFVMSQRWDAKENDVFNDTVTSAIILPIAASGEHAQGAPDWFCIAVGFSSGNVRFFSETLDVLAISRLHNDRVLELKATGIRQEGGKSSKRYTDEDLIVVYPSVICRVVGLSLFQTLRGCRSEVALKRARSDHSYPTISLEYRKYGFSQPAVRDACFIGPRVVNTYDHLFASTLSQGFRSNYRPSPPQQTVIASTGSSFWLQLDHFTEGVVAPLELTDVAMTVISKLPSWLGMTSAKVTEPPPKPIERLSPHCRLLDTRREGKAIVCSPDRSLLAVVDSVGRVTLVEARTGVAIRMWKGYRDAECGFLEVVEDVLKKRHRRDSKNSSVHPEKVVLFVIYAPKKGTIELFPLKHGRKIATLRVKKNGRLLFTPHSLLGFIVSDTSRSKSNPRKVSKLPSGSANLVFLSEDGLMDLVVPFHCAIMDASAKAKDMHLLKQLKTFAKEVDREDSSTVEHLTSLVKGFETDEVRLMAIDVVLTVKWITPTLAKTVIDVFLDISSDKDLPNSEGSSLISICKQLQNVIKFYCLSQEIKTSKSSTKDSNDAEPPLEDVLLLSKTETQLLLDFVKKFNALKPGKDGRVTFQVTTEENLSRFLQSFDFADDGPVLQILKPSDDEYRTIGEILFSGVSENLESLNEWMLEAETSKISPPVLAKCLITYWLHRPIEPVQDNIRRFVRLLTAVCFLAGDVASPDYSNESCWWTEIRGLIRQCCNSITALITALCCRAVSITFEQAVELKKNTSEKGKSNVAIQDWESISADTWQWDMLLSYLEDVSILNTVLTTRPTEKTYRSSEVAEVTLEELTNAGDGAVTELVAKWLWQFQIPPNLLIDQSDVEFQNTSHEIPAQVKGKRKIFKEDDGLVWPLVEMESRVEPESDVQQLVLDKLRLLKNRFPFSLTSSVLLSHLGWEGMKEWQKDITDPTLLACAIDYLIAIPSAHLKTGVCDLVWNTYLKVHLESITRLMAKMGKLPTDTLCTREIGIPRTHISKVLKHSATLLSNIVDACSERPRVQFTRQRDPLWAGMSDSSALSVITVAVARPMPSEELVLLHHQVITVMYLVAALEIKDRTALTALFDSVKSALFGELVSRRGVSYNQHYLEVRDSLLSLLRRAISAAVQTIREVEGSAEDKRQDSREACEWMRIIMDLGSTWHLPLDALRRQYVCELYSCGYDKLAEEEVSTVNDTALLASQLLVVVGQRIKTVIASSSSPHQVIAQLSPLLTTWLNSLDDASKDSRPNLRDTGVLMTYILKHLPKNHMDVKLANLMYEYLFTLCESEGNSEFPQK